MMRDPQEALEILDGSRAGKRGRAAVRIEDLQPILQLSTMTAKEISDGSAPTAAQYNAVVKDLAKVTSALAQVAAALQRKLRT